MTTPYMVSGFHITDLHQHETHDGVAFVCTIHEQGVPVGRGEQAGRGGCCTLLFRDPAAGERFTAAARTYHEREGKREVFEIEDRLLYHLIEGFELDRDSARQTICLTSLVDELGIHEHRGWTPPLRPAQLAQVTRHYPDCTHVWVIGVGWTPLT